MKVALSFSGGKDSCLAFYQLQQQDASIACLITTVWKGGQTVAHGEKLETIKEQAKSLGIPVHFIETDFDKYTEDFVEKLKKMKEIYDIDGVAFGDIYLDGHRKWGEEVAQQAKLKPFYPIWTDQKNVLDLLHKIVELNFKARVIKVDSKKLPVAWVGRNVNKSFIADVTRKNVCPMGESGEYHTTVYDGPIFQFPIK
ncbi:diphthine--ammonia ligase [Virgibacillus ndiopensis]|uniref:Dph6-related ATP pyrophosphatase n=1 Tax=Virgibacillus ndiopensis TaxID=2004408 RepID=UPI000C080ADE|nr:diphthine--ammonia ligase [Virgibacillus ndiopensis]